MGASPAPVADAGSATIPSLVAGNALNTVGGPIASACSNLANRGERPWPNAWPNGLSAASGWLVESVPPGSVSVSAGGGGGLTAGVWFSVVTGWGAGIAFAASGTWVVSVVFVTSFSGRKGFQSPRWGRMFEHYPKRGFRQPLTGAIRILFFSCIQAFFQDKNMADNTTKPKAIRYHPKSVNVPFWM